MFFLCIAFTKDKLLPIMRSNVDDLHVIFSNPCLGKDFSDFFQKPFWYNEYVKHNSSSLCALENNYVLFIDSDVIYNSNSVTSIWDVYEKERKGKPILISTETCCWVGRVCNERDYQTWYYDWRKIDSYSIFLNSGVMMGTFPAFIPMFDYIIANNNSYRVSYGRKPPTSFDDQMAIADYVKRVSRFNSTVQLDYKQALSGTVSFIISDYELTMLERKQLDTTKCMEQVTCVNKNYDNNITLYACPMLQCLDGFMTITEDCRLTRNLTVAYKYNHDLHQLHPTPIFFHTTGGTKRHIHGLTHMRRHCIATRASGNKLLY